MGPECGFPLGKLRSAQVEARGCYSATGPRSVMRRHPVRGRFHEHVPTVVQNYRQLLRTDIGSSPDPSPDEAAVEEVNDLSTQDREGRVA